MKKILIIVAIVFVSTACSSFKFVESTEKGSFSTKIALDIAVGNQFQAGNSSNEMRNKQLQRQGSGNIDRKIIYQAQKKLKKLGYDPGPLDGIWGPKTQKASKKFQQDHRLPVTGKLNQETIRKLMQTAEGDQKDSIVSVDQKQTYSLMTTAEARQLIDRHIRQNDIQFETPISYLKRTKKSASDNRADIFQGVKFDNENYLVFALCEPVYRLVKPAEDLPNRLAKQNINIPDELTFTFNGILYSTVNLEVKTNPTFSYTEPGGFIDNSNIPKGGYELLIGEFGMNLGNTFIFYHNPLKKDFIESWRSQPNVFMIKTSLPKGKGILLNLYRY